MQQYLIIKLTWLLRREGLAYQEDEEQTPNKVRPDVNCLVVEHEEALGDFCAGVEVDSVARHYQAVVLHVLVSLFECTNIARFISTLRYCFTCLFMLLSFEGFLIFKFSGAGKARTSC